MGYVEQSDHRSGAERCVEVNISSDPDTVLFLAVSSGKMTNLNRKHCKKYKCLKDMCSLETRKEVI